MMNFKIFVLTAVFVFSVGMSKAQKTAKEAVKYVESIDFGKELANPQFPIEQYCYITGNGFINPLVVGGENAIGSIVVGDNAIAIVRGSNEQGGLIPSGHVNLSLRYAVKINTRADSVYHLFQQFNFEAGKSYQIRFRMKEREFYLEEDANNKMEWIKSFKTYPEANPGHLNGMWNCEKKRAMNTFYMQYAIEGNRVVFEGTNKIIDKPLVAEGCLLYNEHIIVMFPEKATNSGKEDETFGSQPKYVWYYTLADGVLHIEGGRRFGNMKGFGPVWENTGEFRKTN